MSINLDNFIARGMAHVINVSSMTQKFVVGGARPGLERPYEILPGEETLIEAGYLKRRVNGGGTVIPSAVDMLTCRHDAAGRFDVNIPERIVRLDSPEAIAYLARRAKSTSAGPASEPASKPAPAKEAEAPKAPAKVLTAAQNKATAKKKTATTKKAAKKPAANAGKDPFEVKG